MIRYFVSANKNPLIHVSSGELLKAKNFVHQRRRLDTFVIIICVDGTLHIVQDEFRHTLKKDDYIVLFAGHEHYGDTASENPVTYIWCHFSVKKNDYKIVNKSELEKIISFKNKTLRGGHKRSRYYILPEQGNLSNSRRVFQLFHQVLDITRENAYSAMFPNYAISLLAMEISQEFLLAQKLIPGREINHNMQKVIEWIRINYNRRLSLLTIGDYFHYNADYLSTAFRRYSGISLMKYVTQVRIAAAKKELINTQDTIKEIAYRTGFIDESNFFRKFKELESITPTAYRAAFSRAKLVRGNTKKGKRG